MTKWEYWVDFVGPDSQSDELAGGMNPQVSIYMAENYPGVMRGRYNPKYLEAWLNLRGADGWEVALIEPVNQIGDERDWTSPHGTKNYGSWIRSYLVILRRKIEEMNDPGAM